MHSRVPRATRMRTDSLPSDRTPDRKAPPRRVAKEHGNDRTRLNLAPEEQAKRNLRNTVARSNLAAMCLEQSPNIAAAARRFRYLRAVLGIGPQPADWAQAQQWAAEAEDPPVGGAS